MRFLILPFIKTYQLDFNLCKPWLLQQPLNYSTSFSSHLPGEQGHMLTCVVPKSLHRVWPVINCLNDSPTLTSECLSFTSLLYSKTSRGKIFWTWSLVPFWVSFADPDLGRYLGKPAPESTISPRPGRFPQPIPCAGRQWSFMSPKLWIQIIHFKNAFLVWKVLILDYQLCYHQTHHR